MIIVDSSVWIAWLRNTDSDAVRKLAGIRNLADVGVGDIVLLEVLQGARDARDAARIDLSLRAFSLVTMLDFDIARRAAANFRTLRELGLRVRTASDLVIGTFCIEHGHVLLHQDKDFAVMEKHLGLRVA